MKKIIIIMMTMMMLAMSVNAGTVIFDQDSVIKDRSEDLIGNTLADGIAGSANDETITASNFTYTGDYKLEFFDLNTKYYVVLENPFVNTTMNLTWFFNNDASASAVAINQELTLNEVGTYYFEIKPETEGEKGAFMMGFPDSFVGTVLLQVEERKGFNTLMAGFVGGFSDVVEINVQFWRIAYYLIIFVVVVGFILALFGLVFTLFNWIVKIRQSKGLVSQSRRD